LESVEKIPYTSLSVLDSASSACHTLNENETTITTEGRYISRLMRARILDGLSKHLGRAVTRDEIDEFGQA